MYESEPLTYHDIELTLINDSEEDDSESVNFNPEHEIC